MSKFRPSPALVVSTIALLVASGGTSYAALTLPRNSVGTRQIRNKAVTLPKIAPGAQKALAKAGPQGPPGAQGQPGAPGQNGTNGTNGAPGTARAYGLVNGTTVTQSKNITGVTNPFVGKYCVSLAAGIDPSTTGVEVTPDFTIDDTSFSPGNGKQAIVEWASNGFDCPAGTLEVVTGVRTESTAVDPQGGNTFVTQVTNTLSDAEGFFIVVP
jgi:hypothetical protein